MKFKGNIFLYIFAGGIFFIFWLLVVFPYDALQSRIITEIENQSQGRYKIEMADLDVSLFGSVTFEKLKVFELAGGQKALLLKSPKFKLGFSPLGLFSKKMDFSFYLKGNKKGDIKGEFKGESDNLDLNLKIDDFPLSDLSFLSSKAKLGLKGTLEGEVNLKLNKVDPAQNKGFVELQLVNLSLDPMKIALDPTDPSTQMEIPKIKISGAKGSQIKAEVKKDKLEIGTFKLSGGDFELTLGGNVMLRGKTAQDYRMALHGNFKISESLAKALPFLFILEQQKNSEGVYPLSITGRLGKPNIRIGKFRVPI